MSPPLLTVSSAIRPSDEDDVTSITAIYAHYVLHGLASFEIVPPSESDMRQRRLEIIGQGFPYLVAEHAGDVVGYAYASPYRPCNSANAMIPGAPDTTRNAAPSGCSAEASRAKETGWNECKTPNSTMRAPTWAGPTNAAAVIAAGADAPAACSKAGRCAAIAPCTNQVAEKKKAKIGIAARGGTSSRNSLAPRGSAADVL